MTQVLVGFQILFALALGASGLAHLTNFGGLACFLFGGIPAAVIFVTLMFQLPKIAIIAGAVAWGWTGYSLAVYPADLFQWGDDTLILLGVISAAIGGYSNFRYVADAGAFQKAEPIETASGRTEQSGAAPQAESSSVHYDPTDTSVDQAADLEGYDRWQLAHGLDHLLRARAIRQTTYNRAVIQLPIEYTRVAPNAINMASLEREEVTPRSLMYMAILHEAGLISNAEREAAVQVIETQIGDLSDDDYQRLSFIGEREEGAQRAAYEIRVAEANGDYLHLSGALFELVYCRAISIETFRRAIVEADPEYDLSYAKIENFPYQKPRESAEKDLEQLLKTGLIARSERDQALKVVAEARRAA